MTIVLLLNLETHKLPWCCASFTIKLRVATNFPPLSRRSAAVRINNIGATSQLGAHSIRKFRNKMLSFVEASCDWPVTSSGLAKTLSFSHFRRSVSMPSDYSDSNSERSSPVDEMKFEEVFISQAKEIKKLSTKEKKKLRKLKSVNKNQVQDMDKLESESANQQEEESDKKKKKKKKWKKMDLSDLGFNMSLLPRPAKSPSMNDDDIHNILEDIDQEYLDMEEKMTPYEHLNRLEGNRQEDKYVRLDRDRKIRKAHKQVKDKYCRSVRNNDGRKKLYIHHRVMRLMQLEADRAHLHYPTPPKKNQPDRIEKPVSDHAPNRRHPARAPPPQNLAHALHNDNVVSGDLPTDLISLLISLQHRDISPEDYDTLLRLDESVAPKTVSDSKLKSFKTDLVNESNAGEICSICMDPYEIGQQRKFLPCDHVFHNNCIDMWLQNSSMNCPLDGLPVDS